MYILRIFRKNSYAFSFWFRIANICHAILQGSLESLVFQKNLTDILIKNVKGFIQDPAQCIMFWIFFRK